MKHTLIAVFLLASAQSASALAQNIKLAGVDINPVVSMKQSYDSNIYLTKDAVKSANINRSAAGLNADKTFGARLDLKGGYLMELITYSRAGNINNAVHHSFSIAADAKLPRNTTLTVKNDFAHTTDQATSELVERAKRLQNTSGLTLESPLRGKFGYGINFLHTYNNYDSLTYDMLDRQEILTGFELNYKVQPKMKLLFDYNYGVLKYAHKNALSNTRSNDSTYNNLDLGLTGDLAPKLTGTVKAGLQVRNYEKNLFTAKNSLTTGGYSAQLVWRAVEKTDIILFGKRANVESSYLNSRFYTSTLTDLSASREVRKIRVGVGFSFETTQYPEKTAATGAKRFDHNTNVRLTADYNVQKWLKAGFGYTYKNRSSNESKNDYKDNVIGIDLKGMF